MCYFVRKKRNGFKHPSEKQQDIILWCADSFCNHHRDQAYNIDRQRIKLGCAGLLYPSAGNVHL